MTQLVSLLQDITCRWGTGVDRERCAQNITCDSRKVQEGFVYVALCGEKFDGHDFAQDALDQGAGAVVVKKDLGLAQQILVEDTNAAYAKMCANFFAQPAQEMKLVGVTGTNGKTTITTSIFNILEAVGYKTGLLGTIQICYGDVTKKVDYTTPDAYVFNQTLREMADAGCSHVVLEVSSHALAQKRVFDVPFEVGVFTNLSPDHLDYHHTMEEYFVAKQLLFSMTKQNLIHIGNEAGNRLKTILGEDAVTFGIAKPEADLVGAAKTKAFPDFCATDLVCKMDAVTFTLTYQRQTHPVRFAIPGRYSVENALAVLGVCTLLGVPLEQSIKTLGEMSGVRGRCEVLYQDQRMTVIGDYAHTPDGIENVLSSLQEIKTGRLVALFGCGGDRDRTKRPLMAKACEAYADIIIVTSDNPRSEDPNAIIAEIVPGFSKNATYTIKPDRTEAIAYAMTSAKQEDLIVLLGKGHEDYQILQKGKIHYDEREIVQQIAKFLRTNGCNINE